MSRYKLCSRAEFGDADRKSFQLDSKDLVVFRTDTQFYAIDRRCSHMGGNLAKGKRPTETSIKCPVHGAEFDLRTGEVVNQVTPLVGWIKKAQQTRTYPVVEEDGVLFIDL